MSKKFYIRTGEGKTVDDWVKYVWPDHAKLAILNYIPDYRKTVKLRTSNGKPTISRPIGGECRIVINYNSGKNCFIVWDAGIQNRIHHGQKMHLPMGKAGEDLLHKPIDPNSVTPFFREFTQNGTRYVEMISLVGGNALEDFCKNYRERILPNRKEIPEGRICLYTDDDGSIKEISREE